MENIKQLKEDLELLVSTPGPTRHIAQTEGDLRIGQGANFPLYAVVWEIVSREREYGADIRAFSHNGNILVVGGLNFNPNKHIRAMPKIVVHGDECTYHLTKERGEGGIVSIPTFATGAIEKHGGVMHPGVSIYGFRGDSIAGRAFEHICEGKVRLDDSLGKKMYYIEPEAVDEVREFDVAVQNYGPKWKQVEGLNILYSKAIDPRASVAAGIHAVSELSKEDISCTLIISGDEEGNPKPGAARWSKWLPPTMREYVNLGNFILISDGFDGVSLTEAEEGKYETSVLVPTGLSDGRGATNEGMAALARDILVPHAQSAGIGVRTTSDYVSRTVDNGMLEYPNITFADWSAGKAQDSQAICHLNESIAMEQVNNLAKYMVRVMETVHPDLFLHLGTSQER